MTRFSYRAQDESGAPIEGQMEAESAWRVTRRLQERGYTVNSVEPVYAEAPFIRISKRLTWDELEFFSTHLAAVTQSGLPLAPAVKALAEEGASPPHAKGPRPDPERTRRRRQPRRSPR